MHLADGQGKANHENAPDDGSLDSVVAARPDGAVAQSRTEEGGQLTAQARYAEPAKGMVHFAIYATEDDFLRRPIAVHEAALKDGLAEVSFTDVAEGEYAISAYLDLNGNGELIALVRRAERTGRQQQRAKGRFGPPSWNDASFTLSDVGNSVSFTLVCPVGCD